MIAAVSGIGVLSSIRGYVLAEGLWSKAQKRAVVAVHRYARSGSDEDWTAFEDEIALTLGDRMAREELERAGPDMDVVRRGFSQGDIPDGVPFGNGDAFSRFRDVSFVAAAIDIWAEAPDLRRVDELLGKPPTPRWRWSSAGGATASLAKPFSPAELLKVVRRLLDRTR